MTDADGLVLAVARALTVAEARRRFKWTPEGQELDEMVPALFEAAGAALSAISAAGWQVVPKEATIPMLNALAIGYRNEDSAWADALAAAPKVPG